MAGSSDSKVEADFGELWNALCGELFSVFDSTSGRNLMVQTHAVRQVAEKDFEATVLKSDKPVLVDFWAPWCGPCRIIGPIVEDLAPSYEGRAVLSKINVDENPGIAQAYGVTSIPTLMIFKNGKVVDRAIGAIPRSELQKFIDRNL
jgi:thioredoxin 1